MEHIKKNSGSIIGISLVLLCVLGAMLHTKRVAAAVVNVPGNQNVTAIVLGPPPTTQATILSPLNNQTVTTTPLVVSGSCGGTNNTVRVFLNGQLAGITACQVDGTFSLNIILSYGRNDISAFVYDISDQVGPNSDIVTVTVLEPNTQQLTAPDSSTNSDGASSGNSGNSSYLPVESSEVHRDLFTKEPFKSFVGIIGVNCTSSTSSFSVKLATILSCICFLLIFIAALLLLLYWLVGFDPRKTRAYRALAKILSK